MIEWKKIDIEEELIFDHYYRQLETRSCEYTFANNVLWSPYYDITYGIVEDMLVFLLCQENDSVSFPIGADNLKRAIEVLMQYFAEQNKEFRMHLVTSEQFEKLEAVFPDMFEIEYDRDVADYIYESEKLITLSGKKLHSKRNHINKFKQENPNWSYEEITTENLDDCKEMAKIWMEQQEEVSENRQIEFQVTLAALDHMKRLKLEGGLIRVDGKVIAFSLGEPVCEKVYMIHIEKAFPQIQGAYPMINQQFAEHAASKYVYINREEDMGEEGLRKAKLSYYPAFLKEKGIVTLKK